MKDTETGTLEGRRPREGVKRNSPVTELKTKVGRCSRTTGTGSLDDTDGEPLVECQGRDRTGRDGVEDRGDGLGPKSFTGETLQTPKFP